MAIDCHSVKQHIAKKIPYDKRMTAKEILRRNLRALMDATPKYDTREKLAQAAGISPRNVGYMLQRGGNPTLKSMEAVAAVFKLEAWELLIDHQQTRRRLITRILETPSQVESTTNLFGRPPPPKNVSC